MMRCSTSGQRASRSRQYDERKPEFNPDEKRSSLEPDDRGERNSNALERLRRG
jgi:hypothetical protein